MDKIKITNEEIKIIQRYKNIGLCLFSDENYKRVSSFVVKPTSGTIISIRNSIPSEKEKDYEICLYGTKRFNSEIILPISIYTEENLKEAELLYVDIITKYKYLIEERLDRKYLIDFINENLASYNVLFRNKIIDSFPEDSKILIAKKNDIAEGFLLFSISNSKIIIQQIFVRNIDSEILFYLLLHLEKIMNKEIIFKIQIPKKKKYSRNIIKLIKNDINLSKIDIEYCT